VPGPAPDPAKGSPPRGPLLLIGVGQPDRGDDALGLVALVRLAEILPACPVVPRPVVQCVAHHGEGLGLIALWEGRGQVVLLDAMDAGQPPGTLLRLTPNSGSKMAKAFRASSHTFGVAEAVEMARVLDRLPESLVLLGLQGACWDLGAPLSDPVAAALPALLEAAISSLTDPVSRRPGGASP